MPRLAASHVGLAMVCTEFPKLEQHNLASPALVPAFVPGLSTLHQEEVSLDIHSKVLISAVCEPSSCHLQEDRLNMTALDIFIYLQR